MASYSLNVSAFPYVDWYEFDNGTTIYFNPAYSFNWQCNATFEADPDIAGIGVMASYIATGCITVFVAAIRASFDWRDRYAAVLDNRSVAKPDPNEKGLRKPLKKMLYWLQLVFHIAVLRDFPCREPEPENLTAAKTVLQALADLQLLTSTSILIAGMVQLNTISYYHQSIIMEYWWIAVNSFWASRPDLLREDVRLTVPVVVRRILRFLSTVLAVAFLFIKARREIDNWVPFESGRCFLDPDRSAPDSVWLWESGIMLYAFFTLLSITFPSIKWVREYSKAMHRIQDYLERSFKEKLDLFDPKGKRTAVPTTPGNVGTGKKQQPLTLRARFIKVAANTLNCAVYICAALFWRLLIEFLEVWAYGSGFYALQVVVYAAMVGWCSAFIINVKIYNQNLIQGDEQTWGFGQVLPVALLLVIFISALDALSNLAKEEEKNSSQSSASQV